MKRERHRKVIIVGAAGQDFHNFNTFYRDNPQYNVVAFTAAQIPDIADRKYPASLAGPLYPEGIPIHSQDELISLIKEFDVDECVFSYSDVPYAEVMRLGAKIRSRCRFFNDGAQEHYTEKHETSHRRRCGTDRLWKKPNKPPNNRDTDEQRFQSDRYSPSDAILAVQRVQRFASIEDLARHKCTIEEM